MINTGNQIEEIPFNSENSLPSASDNDALNEAQQKELIGSRLDGLGDELGKYVKTNQQSQRDHQSYRCTHRSLRLPFWSPESGVNKHLNAVDAITPHTFYKRERLASIRDLPCPTTMTNDVLPCSRSGRPLYSSCKFSPQELIGKKHESKSSFGTRRQ